jgi:hypothetical protein
MFAWDPFGRRDRQRHVEALQRELARELREAAKGSNARLALYAEVDAVSVNGDTLQLRPGRDPMVQRLPQRVTVRIRELWSATLLAAQPRWSALTLCAEPDGTMSLAFIYPEQFDALVGYDRRRSRAWVRLLGQAPFAPANPTGSAAP